MASQRDRDEENQRLSRMERIRNSFRGSSINSFAEELDRAGFWTAKDRRDQRIVGRNKEVRQALGQIQEDGLPFAIATAHEDDDGLLIFARPSRIDVPSYTLTTSRRTNYATGILVRRDRLVEFCELLHGIRPDFSLSYEQMAELRAQVNEQGRQRRQRQKEQQQQPRNKRKKR